MALAVQTFLQSNPPEDLTSLLGIAVKQHPQYPNLYHFSYDMIDSPKDHPIVLECRGIILDKADNWKVVAFPFRRFANVGESWAAPIDWNSVRVQEKVDGTLCCLANYQGAWQVSTKGSADAGGQVGDFLFTFAHLFWKTFWAMKIHTEDLNPNYTYSFELTSTYNRIVCRYGAEPMLTLIGVRDIVSEGYPELPVADFKIGVPVVREFPLTTIKEIETAALTLDAISQEGFVVVDQFFNRVKVKSPTYVMLHHLVDGMSQRRMIRLIQLGETSETLSYFPEYQSLFDEISGKIDCLIAGIEADYESIKHLTDRKEFALRAQKMENSGVLFALFSGKTKNVRDHILHSKKIMKSVTQVPEFAFTAEKIKEMIGV